MKTTIELHYVRPETIAECCTNANRILRDGEMHILMYTSRLLWLLDLVHLNIELGFSVAYTRYAPEKANARKQRKHPPTGHPKW